MSPIDARDAIVEDQYDAIRVYRVRIDPNHTPEDVLKPHYWAAQAAFQEGDEIVVQTADLGWRQTLLVLEVDRASGRTVVAPMTDVVRFERGPVPTDFEVRFINAQAGFTVLNREKETMREGFRTFQGARQWLLAQIGDMSAAPSAPGQRRERKAPVEVAADV